MAKPKTYQVPKADHPWRQYANKKPGRKAVRTDIIPMREFLGDIVDNWEKYEIYDRKAFRGGGFRKISKVPQQNAAAWLSSMVKKIYIDEV